VFVAQPDDHPVSSGRRIAVALAEAAWALHAASVTRPEAERLTRWTAIAACSTAQGEVAAVCLISRDGPPRWTTAGPGAPAAHLLPDPRDDDVLLSVVRGERAWVDVAGEATRSRLAVSFGVERLAVSGIPAQTGAGHGILLVGRSSPWPDEEEAQAVVVALAAHLGVALENRRSVALLADSEASHRETVHHLQEAVRTPVPHVPHTELGVHYQAADPVALTGGDLYDWVVLPAGHLHVAVVDAVGKGVTATKDALAVTHALRLLALDGCPLEDLVARADRLVTAQNPHLAATLVVGRYEPATGHLALAGGGHPPPLLVSGSEVRELAIPGRPVGWPGAGSDTVTEVVLGRSDTVIFYTDGLIEGTRDIVSGLRLLGIHARETAGYPAKHLARALVERALAGAVRHDDSVALVLRRRTPPLARPGLLLGPFEYRFSPTPATVPLARHLLRDWLDRVPVDSVAEEDIVLVASELCTNAVRHATGRPSGVALRAWVEGTDLVIEVEDDGTGPLEWPAELDRLPEPAAEGGRGLFLVDAFSDRVDVEASPDLTVVRCVKEAVVAPGATLHSATYHADARG